MNTVVLAVRKGQDVRTMQWVLLTSLMLFLASTAKAQQPAFKPVASVNQLMKAFVIPSSDAVFGVAIEAPQDDEAWTVLQNNALILAESGNLLMIGSRAKDNDAWIKAAQALVDAGTVTFKAAEAKNVDALIEAGDQVYATCEGCHSRYLPASE